MAVFKTPYATTVGSALKTTLIEKAIKECLVREPWLLTSNKFHKELGVVPVVINGSSSSEANIPFFGHPVSFEYKGQEYLAVDFRQYARVDIYGNIQYRNVGEFGIIEDRFAISLAWLTGSIGNIKSDLKMAGVIYANWISETVSKRYALDPSEQMLITSIAYIYYNSLFEESTVVNEEDGFKYISMLAKQCRIPEQFGKQALEAIKDIPLTDISSLIAAIRVAVPNIRLEDLSVGSLLTILSNTWFMTNAKEMIAVAIEHPPTWIVICNAALNERTYRNSQIARIAERFVKSGALNEFKFAYNELCRIHVSTEELDPLKSLGDFE